MSVPSSGVCQIFYYDEELGSAEYQITIFEEANGWKTARGFLSGDSAVIGLVKAANDLVTLKFASGESAQAFFRSSGDGGIIITFSGPVPALYD